MGARTIETPAVIEGSEAILGGTHGHPAVRVQCLEIGGYVFYRGVKSGALYEPCGRCDLSGHFEVYAGIAGGVCFSCGGAGYVSRKPGDTLVTLQEVVRKRLVAKAAKARKAEREAERGRQEAAAWAAANTEVAEGLAAFRTARGAAYAAIAAGADESDAWETLRSQDSTLVEFSHKAARQALTEAQTSFAAILLAREAERVARQVARDTAKAASQHLGTVGEKLTAEGTVKVAANYEADSFRGYGGTVIKRIIVLDVEGNDVVIFSDAQWAWDAERGQALKLTGTVKRHGERDGAKQTTLGGRIKVG